MDPLLAQVHSLIEETELVNVRLTSLHVDTADSFPEALRVEFRLSNIVAGGGPSDDPDQPGFIAVSVSHEVRCYVEDDTVATLTLTHQAVYQFNGATRPADEAVGQWIHSNVIFMLYPYVREVIQTTATKVGLPAIILGYLKRDRTMPENITALSIDSRIEQ